MAYFSCTLSRAEKNFCITQCVLLAVVLALQHFQPYWHGSHSLIHTNHSSLTCLLNFKYPERQVARRLEALKRYDFDIQHRAEQHHYDDYALSWHPRAALECNYSQRQEKRGQMMQMAVNVHTGCRGWWRRSLVRSVDNWG